METDDTPKPKDIRQTILRLMGKLLGGPYLPVNMLVLLALVVLTDYAYVLMREPLAYWFDYSQESIRSIGGFEYGPLAAAGVYLVYIAVVWIILRAINRKVSLVLWSGLLLWHLSTFIIFPPTCNYDTLRLFPDWLCFIHRDIVTIVIGLIVGLVLSRSIFPSEQADGRTEYRTGLHCGWDSPNAR